MPTREYKRIWCKTCNEFELHYHNYKDNNLVCKECGTVYTDVYLKDIPKEKIIEQRKRYKLYRKESFNKMFSRMAYVSSLSMFNPFAETDDVEIIESDAGQRAIDEEERQERKKEREQIIIEREKEKERYKQFIKLNRNDLCICGSGKKYKNCCWHEIQKIRP